MTGGPNFYSLVAAIGEHKLSLVCLKVESSLSGLINCIYLASLCELYIGGAADDRFPLDLFATSELAVESDRQSPQTSSLLQYPERTRRIRISVGEGKNGQVGNDT